MPVTIVGAYGSGRGSTEYLRAAGVKERIPKERIEWVTTNQKNADSRDKKLEAQVNDLSSRLHEMERKWDELENRNRELETKNQDLQAKLDLITAGSLPLEIQTSNLPSRSRPRSILNRTSGWVGSRMPWGDRPEYVDYRIVERDDGPVMVATEEHVDGYSIEDRRRGTAVVAGALAVAGAIVLTAWLWGEHEEHEGPKPAPAVTLPATPHIEHDKTAGAGHRHQGLFHNGKAFKVSLPGNLDWEENANGSYRIDDIAGHHIVPHVYWDQQGNLDPDSKQLLLTTPYHHFKLKQDTYNYHTPGTDFDQHYQTVVENQ